MGCYRRLVSDAFRRYNRKTSPVEKCVSRNSFSSTSDLRRSGLGISQPIFRRSDLQNVINNNYQRKIPFVAKRFYSAHVKPMGYRNLALLGFVGGLVVIPVYYWNSETVPYVNRGNFVLLPTYLEKKMGELQLKLLNKGEILASDHPESIRVVNIGKDIIGALRKKLDDDDDKKTAHLKEFNWEIVVVDDPTTVKAKCLSGGKIVVSTGLLNYLKTDAEIATVIAREVGDAVARPTAAKLSGILWKAMIVFFVFYLSTSNPPNRPPWAVAYFVVATTFMSFWICSEFVGFVRDGRDNEARKIGLLISASAGYDPRIAMEVYEKLKSHSSSASASASVLNVCRLTDPNGKTIAQRLSEPKVMEEALSIYREALNGKN